MKILIAERDQLVADCLELMLQSISPAISIQKVFTANHAIQVYEENPYDFVLFSMTIHPETDRSKKVNITSLYNEIPGESLKLFKNKFPDSKIIVTTGFDFANFIELLIEHRIDPNNIKHLHKPFQIQDLKKVIKHE